MPSGSILNSTKQTYGYSSIRTICPSTCNSSINNTYFSTNIPRMFSNLKSISSFIIVCHIANTKLNNKTLHRTTRSKLSRIPIYIISTATTISFSKSIRNIAASSMTNNFIMNSINTADINFKIIIIRVCMWITNNLSKTPSINLKLLNSNFLTINNFYFPTIINLPNRI